MNVFDLQASLTLKVSDYEKALLKMESETKKVCKQIEKESETSTQNITKNYNKIFNGDIYKDMSKTVNDYSHNVTNIYKNITREAESSGDSQKRVYAQTWENIKNTVSTKVKEIANFFSTIGNAAKSAFDFVFNVSRAAFSKVLEVGKSAFSGIAGFARDSFSGLGDILSSSMNGAVDMIGNATSALIDFGKQSVEVGMQFDKSMSQVAATLETTTEDLATGSVGTDFTFGSFSGNLREMAITLGENTKFTASEVAEAMNNMALAGYKQQEIADSIEDVLNTASAGNIAIADAATYITKSKNALGLTPEETKILADQMAVTASNSGSTVASLGQGIMKIGANARFLKGGTTELTQILGILSNNGENLTGSSGGTALRNIIKNLQNPRSDAAAADMERLGISAYDDFGNMRYLSDIFADFRSAMQGMSDQEQSEILNDIFTAYSIVGAQALMETPQEAFDKLKGKLENSDGAAARMAQEQQNNLFGDITIFNSALDAVRIRISDRLTPTLRDFVKFGTEQMGRLAKAIKSSGLEKGFETLTSIIGNTIGEINKILPKAVKTTNKIFKAIVKGIRDNAKTIGSGLAETLTELSDLPVEIIPDMIDGGMKIGIAIMDGLAESAPKIVKKIPKFISRINQAIQNNAKQFGESGKTLLQTIFKSVEDNKQSFKTAFGNLYHTVIEPAVSGLFVGLPSFISGKIKNIDFSGIGDMLSGIDFVDRIKNKIKSLDISTIISEVSTLGNNIFDSAVDILFSENGIDWKKVGDGINTIVQSVDYSRMGQSINTLINGFLDSTNTLLETIDWKSVGSGVGIVINGIDFSGILKKVFDTIGNIIKSNGQLLSGVASAIDEGTAGELIAIGSSLLIGKSLVKMIANYLATSEVLTVVVTALKGLFSKALPVLGTAVIAWDVGTFIRNNILNADEFDKQVDLVLDSVRNKVYKFKAFMNSFGGLVNDQNALYEAYIADDYANGFGFASDEYNIAYQDWIESNKNRGYLNPTSLTDFINDDYFAKIHEKFNEQVVIATTSGSDMANNFASGINQSFPEIVKSVGGITNYIARNMKHSVPAEGALSDDDTWFPDMMKSFASGINSNAYLIRNEINTIANIINQKFTSLDSFSWGYDMMINFQNGINAAWAGFIQSIQNIANTIHDYLGFSEPKKGALSDFHTYAPDMMNLFASGIRDNTGVLESQLQDTSSRISNAISGDYTGSYQIPVQSYAGSNQTVSSSPVQVQTLEINISGAEFASDYDVEKFVDKLIPTIQERLDVREKWQQRGKGGAGFGY